jgi:hypothetical protein
MATHYPHKISLVIVAGLLAATPVLSQQPDCPRPAIAPVIEITDMLFDPAEVPPQPGEPAGDGVCELYCGIAVADEHSFIPACSSYPCTFTLSTAGVEIRRRPLTFGPRYDGMAEPTSTGTVCIEWSESFEPGWYHATLECADSAIRAEFDLQISRSRVRGFDIPPTLWRDTNRCPARPAFGEPPNPYEAPGCQGVDVSPKRAGVTPPWSRIARD